MLSFKKQAVAIVFPLEPSLSNTNSSSVKSESWGVKKSWLQGLQFWVFLTRRKIWPLLIYFKTLTVQIGTEGWKNRTRTLEFLKALMWWSRIKGLSGKVEGVEKMDKKRVWSNRRQGESRWWNPGTLYLQWKGRLQYSYEMSHKYGEKCKNQNLISGRVVWLGLDCHNSQSYFEYNQGRPRSSLSQKNNAVFDLFVPLKICWDVGQIQFFFLNLTLINVIVLKWQTRSSLISQMRYKYA